MPSVSTWYPESEVCKSCIVLSRQQCSHGETFCDWQCAQSRETRGSEGRKTQGWNLCSPKRVIENQKQADAWERIWRSDDGNGLSKYRKWSDWLRENTENQSVDSLTHRLEDVASFQPFAAAKAQGKAYSEAARGRVGVCSVRHWPSDGESWSDRAGRDRGGMAEPISQAAHLGTGCGSVFRDVEYPRDPSERGTSADSGKIPDADARPCSPGRRVEHQQAGTHSPQSPSPSKGDRTGRPGTTDVARERRANTPNGKRD